MSIPTTWKPASAAAQASDRPTYPWPITETVALRLRMLRRRLAVDLMTSSLFVQPAPRARRGDPREARPPRAWGVRERKGKAKNVRRLDAFIATLDSRGRLGDALDGENPYVYCAALPGRSDDVQNRLRPYVDTTSTTGLEIRRRGDSRAPPSNLASRSAQRTFAQPI
jgi:hypothetical protein